MAKTMSKSSEIPSFLYTNEYNVDKLIKLRKEINKLNTNQKISYLPFIIKAASLALREFPIINSITLDKRDKENFITEYVMKKDHNISVAIDGSEGLIVPNIKAVQTKSILTIHKELGELREKAMNLRLTSSDLSDGTFSISSIGDLGGKGVNPCILPPQVSILALTRIYDSVKIVSREEACNYDNCLELKNNDSVVAYQKVINMCISADHRVLDGVTVARFSELLKNYIENPLKIWMDSS